MSDILIRTLTSKKGTVYQYRFEVACIDGQRKWVTKSGFKTKKEAKEAGKAAQRDYENTGSLSQPSDISFSDLLDYWLDKDVRMTCKAVTVENYKKKIRLYIKPKLGMYRIKNITKQNIKDFLLGMYDEGFSLNTISVCKSILTKCFDYAIDSHLLSSSPAYKIRMPKKGGKPPKKATRSEPHIYVTADQIGKIFERFPEGTPNHLALMLGYHCGLRLGETFALVWQDIDFQNKTISINRQIQWQADKNRTNKKNSNGTNEAGDGYWYFSEPKYGSYRTITIDDELAGLLKREKAKRDKARDYYDTFYTKYYVDEKIILNGAPLSMQVIAPIKSTGKNEVEFINVRENGTYITPRTLQHTSFVIHHKLGMQDWDFHSLRHTHATMLEEQGASMLYIARRLGHKKINVTADVYANHLTDTLKSRGDKILNGMF